MDAKPRKTIQSVQRAIDIIACFDNKSTELTLGQISTRLGLNKSTVHGILNTLHANNYVTQSDSGKYRLGDFFSNDIRVVDESRNVILRERAKEGMQALANKYAVSAGLFVREWGELVLSNRLLPMTSRYTVMTRDDLIDPLYSSASGKLLLAEMSPEELEAYFATHPLEALTDKTITSKERLLEVLEQVRMQCYAIEDEEQGSGVYAISAPIRDRDGALYATVSATGIAPFIKGREDIIRDLKILAKNLELKIP